MLFSSLHHHERALLFIYFADETMVIYIEKLDEFLRDEHDNSYKLTADYAMKLQFFVRYKLDSNAWWFNLMWDFLAIHLFHHLSRYRDRFVPAQNRKKVRKTISFPSSSLYRLEEKTLHVILNIDW